MNDGHGEDDDNNYSDEPPKKPIGRRKSSSDGSGGNGRKKGPAAQKNLEVMQKRIIKCQRLDEGSSCFLAAALVRNG